MVTIRQYQPSDYDAVKSLLSEAGLFAPTWESPENLDGMIKANPNGVLVGVDGDNLVANIFSVPYGSRIMFFFRLAVRKDYRNQGIATEMLRAAETKAKENGFLETCLFADFHNPMLQAFYKKRQYETDTEAFTCFWKGLV